MSKFYKTPPSLDFLFELLDKISLFKDSYYFIDINSYNKMMYMDLYVSFIDKLKEHYLPNKIGELTKETSYYHFIILIKQICKYHKLTIKSKTINANSKKYTNYLLFCTQ